MPWGAGCQELIVPTMEHRGPEDTHLGPRRAQTGAGASRPGHRCPVPGRATHWVYGRSLSRQRRGASYRLPPLPQTGLWGSRVSRPSPPLDSRLQVGGSTRLGPPRPAPRLQWGRAAAAAVRPGPASLSSLRPANICSPGYEADSSSRSARPVLKQTRSDDRLEAFPGGPGSRRAPAKGRWGPLQAARHLGPAELACSSRRSPGSGGGGWPRGYVRALGPATFWGEPCFGGHRLLGLPTRPESLLGAPARPVCRVRVRA